MAKQHAGHAVAGYLRKYVFAPRYQRSGRLALRAADGVPLTAWLLRGPHDAPATVIVVHGFINWSRTPRVHAFATALSRWVNVIALDLRGHGQSGGTCTMGALEHLDVDAAVDAAATLGPPVVTLGVSLGGVAVLRQGGLMPGKVAGVVSVSAPSHWESQRHGSQRVGRWVSGPAGRAVLARLLRTRVGSLCDATVGGPPVLGAISPAWTVVAHDPDDWYFGPEHADTLYAWASEPKAMWWYPGRGHGTDLLDAELAERLVATIGAGGPSPPERSDRLLGR